MDSGFRDFGLGSKVKGSVGSRQGHLCRMTFAEERIGGGY